MNHGDPFLEALDALEEGLAHNVERARVMRERIAEVRGARAAGRSYSEIIAGTAPVIVQLLSENSRTLDRLGSRVRRAQALALAQEGMTADEIAERFGVSRQRVSALLGDARREATAHD